MMKKKKVCIVSYNFPPYIESLGGGIRAITMAEFFLREGFEVHVIASKGFFFSYFGYEEELHRIRTHYVWNPVNKFFQKGFKKTEGYDVDKPCAPVGWKDKIKRLVFKLRVAVEHFFVPDVGICALILFYFRLSNLIKHHSIDNVIITSPPHSMQLLCLLIKRGSRGNSVNVISDYRDSWNMTGIFAKKFWPLKVVSVHLEKAVLRRCDHFTYVSEAMLDKIQTGMNMRMDKKAHLVMNGFSEMPVLKEENVKCEKTHFLKIGYFGSICDLPESFRNISPILDALDEYSNELPGLQFHFFGLCTLKHHNIKDYPTVHLHPFLPHRSALLAMQEMDFLMVFHSQPVGADEVMTGKLFEYISVKKPIVCIGPNPMAAKDLIDKYGIGITIDIQDKRSIKEALLSLKSLARQDFYQSMDVAMFHRDNQYRTMLSFVL
jgi:glycosyltransferase involved in cell wall biosynthesis